MPDITISIVSHLQGELVKCLLKDLLKVSRINLEIIVTINRPEDESYLTVASPLNLKVIRNKVVKGFGENHNQAFSISTTNFFAVVNPDIRLKNSDLYSMVHFLRSNDIAAVAPRVITPQGEIEDSIRKFPTIGRLLKRKFTSERRSDYPIKEDPHPVDWAAGMFVIFKKDSYIKLQGFDEKYFMYMEDVDICRRLKKVGGEIFIYPGTHVIHQAQRASHKNFKHFLWHVKSMLRYFLTQNS
ncbi:MAG: glycosyl transferase [Gammaproteobacteria bacterium]|nr:glycosyl transferase [Gammaproteobacteria bacterium]|tara:strand:- start:4566 stop:5291 length:726 start_codon:yes stop_codon:yes gene_type:complete